MEIKIQCGCGTKYKFDVEPANGRMPTRVQCPSCSADGTTDANQILAQKIPYVPRPPVELLEPSAVAGAASPGLRIAGSSSHGGGTAVAEAAPAAAERPGSYSGRSLLERTTFFVKERVALLKLTDTYDIFDP